ncbi:chromate transporter [Eubacterium sp.]|uniref:chromate transporter n=1 Tax=Eubacterium sp. TaxID=142586 RepID=UPI00399B7F45
MEEEKLALKKESKKTVLGKLFFSTLYLSTFTFGGGYVIVTLLKDKFVDKLHWVEEDEM